jgi:hypothetical protein
MIDKQYYIIHNALPDELCDGLILDYFMYEQSKHEAHPLIRNASVASPPYKSDIGKFFKQNAKSANKKCNWFFHIDRINTIEFFQFNQGSFIDLSLAVKKPFKTKGFHQKQIKLVCHLALTDPTLYTGGEVIVSNIHKKTLINLKPELKKGSLLILPSFIPYGIKEVIDGNSHHMFTTLEGLSFR